MDRYLVNIRIEGHEELCGENEDEVRKEVEKMLDEIPFNVYYEISISLM